MKKPITIVRYSEAFKHQILREIEKGDLTINSARIKYGISGAHTIQNWARKYSSFGILPKLIRVEKPNEKDQVKALKAEIRDLKIALADMLLDKAIAESTLEVICEKHGLDIESVKKKAGQLLRERHGKKGIQ